MNARRDNPDFPFTMLLHGLGIALFVTSVYLVGLTLTDILSTSFLKFTGAAILFCACDELVWSAWQSWNQWWARRDPKAS
jgi:hypothetical protein